MLPSPSPVQLSVRHDSWIRQQVRDLVLHLDAPVESAELMQAALISLARAAVEFDWEAAVSATRPAGLEAVFSSYAREQIRADLFDEVRQMTHLSRLQRRRWVLVKLARGIVERRLRLQGRQREPSLEELSVLTGLSVIEIDALSRMARLGPWQPEDGSQHLMELRSLTQVTPEHLRQAREDTRIMLEQLAGLLIQCPHERLHILQHQFGVVFEQDGRPLLAGAAPLRPSLWRLLLARMKAPGLDRRPRSTVGGQTDLEELWPPRLGQLLQQSIAGARPASRATRT